MIKVLLADDQELIRQSLSFVMSKQEDIEMVGTAANGCEALELVEEKQPDVVLLDIRMPEMDGVECTRRIKQEFPGIKVIILTTFDDDDYVFDALRYGASGYLLKGVSVDGLTNAVREAARGGSIIAPDVASKVLQMFSRMAQGDVQVRVNKKNALELTKMEWQVIREVGAASPTRRSRADSISPKARCATTSAASCASWNSVTAPSWPSGRCRTRTASRRQAYEPVLESHAALSAGGGHHSGGCQPSGGAAHRLPV